MELHKFETKYYHFCSKFGQTKLFLEEEKDLLA